MTTHSEVISSLDICSLAIILTRPGNFTGWDVSPMQLSVWATAFDILLAVVNMRLLTHDDGCPSQCTLQDAGSIGGLQGVPLKAAARVLPQLLQGRAPQLVNISSGSWRVHKAKASTARVVCWRELGLLNRSGCRPEKCRYCAPGAL